MRVKSSPIIVSESNAELLQLLDSVGQAERYTELTIKETIDKLILYIRKKQFTKSSSIGANDVRRFCNELVEKYNECINKLFQMLIKE